MNGGQGQTLRVNKYTDYLTEMEETIFQTIIDKNQTVVLTIDANETSEYIFYIDFAEASAILQPNTNYLINIFLPEKNNNITNPFQNKQELELYISSSSNNDANAQINEFDRNYDNFLYNNFHAQSIRNNAKLHDNYKTETISKLNNNTDDFVKTYIDYSFALTEMSLKNIDKDFIDKYLINKEISYNNPMYMMFFKEINDKYDLLKNDTTIRGTQLKELIDIYKLMNNAKNARINQDKNLKIIKSGIDKSKYPEHKKLCADIYKFLTQYKAGSIMPIVRFIDSTGNSVIIADTNKYIYYFFFKPQLDLCNIVLDEFRDFNFEKYNIQPVFVSLDMNNIQDTSIFNIYRVQDVVGTHQSLGIRSYPFAIITDNKCKIIKYDAPYRKGELELYLKNEKFTRL
jgi:hypothetical protein